MGDSSINKGEINQKVISIAVIVAALGYFVDIYDLILFSIVRVKSLAGIGITDPQAILNQGGFLLSMQMYGMLLGGIIWGIIGDKKGRLSVLFGSIALYSIANIANAFVTDIPQYAAVRFLAGIGLAGELGAGVTLVSEMMSKEMRGIGTSLVAAVGILGAVVGFFVGDSFNWKVAYLVGGVMGLILLCLRIGVMESGMFKNILSKKISRGNFFSIFLSFQKFMKYLCVILIGLPIWFVVGILITFSPEIGKALGMTVAPNAGKAIMFCYLGLAIGDLCSGLISQLLKSRKRTVLIYLIFLIVFMCVYFFAGPFSVDHFYWVCMGLGVFGGFWAMFVTIASEQFGTNIRATVTTTTPNFVRGMVGPMISIFRWAIPMLGIVGSVKALGVGALVLAFVALYFMKETYGKDLDYLEDPLP